MATIFLPALIAYFNEGHLDSQTFTALYSFPNASVNRPGLILSSNVFYGTTPSGGTSSNGALFKINMDGTGYTNLYSFTAGGGSFPSLTTNSDGVNPMGALAISGNALYGTTRYGGSSGFGTVFAINTDGTGFTNLHTFQLADGEQPNGLLFSSNVLYGTARIGGSAGYGSVFKLNPDGTGFTNLYSFTGGTNGDRPQSALIISSDTLYGTLFSQGSGAGGNPNNGGTVFAINTDGTGFTNLYNFTSGSDGGNPDAALTLSSNMLYGTTLQGGSSIYGTIFAINTNGTGFLTLHSFSGGSDGAGPSGSLILSGNTLYGTASLGGVASNGTVYAINTDGTGFAVLHSFSATSSSSGASTNSDGAHPAASLVLSGNLLYGLASEGGSFGGGTVYDISLLPPQLGIFQSETNVILKWPTYAPSVILQSTTNLAEPATWSAVSPAPVLESGQNTVTNPVSNSQRFYRLSQ